MPSIPQKLADQYDIAHEYEAGLVAWFLRHGVACKRTSLLDPKATDITTADGKPIEVKAPNKFWTPPYVDSVQGWLKKSPKPFAYVIIPPNRNFDECIWIPGDDPKLWKMAKCRHHITRKPYMAYRAHVNLWKPISDLVERLGGKPQ